MEEIDGAKPARSTEQLMYQNQISGMFSFAEIASRVMPDRTDKLIEGLLSIVGSTTEKFILGQLIPPDQIAKAMAEIMETWRTINPEFVAAVEARQAGGKA